MDCRFNKTDLIKRIKKIAENKKNIRLYKKDAIKLISYRESASDPRSNKKLKGLELKDILDLLKPKKSNHKRYSGK